MDVFRLRRTLVDDYQAYIKSFITIQDKHIVHHVEQALEKGHLCPEPLIQLNPNFEPGAWIEQLVTEGVLHSQSSQIFCLDKENESSGKPMRLHLHQSDAVRSARSGDNYILTTGTGSVKSLAYKGLIFQELIYSRPILVMLIYAGSMLQEPVLLILS